MTKKQRIERLERVIKEMARMLALSVTFYDYEKFLKDSYTIHYNTFEKPAIWNDERFKALFEYLDIVDIIRPPVAPSPEFEVLAKKKK